VFGFVFVKICKKFDYKNHIISGLKKSPKKVGFLFGLGEKRFLYLHPARAEKHLEKLRNERFKINSKIF
jgi:hypothetical protein